MTFSPGVQDGLGAFPGVRAPQLTRNARSITRQKSAFRVRKFTTRRLEPLQMCGFRVLQCCFRPRRNTRATDGRAPTTRGAPSPDRGEFPRVSEVHG